MQILKLTALAIVIGLLAGCNATPTTTGMLTGKPYPPNPPLPITHCIDLICKVNVSIVLVLPPNFSCSITVDPPILDLSGGPAIQTIEWTITSPAIGKWPGPTDPYLPVQFEHNAQNVISNLAVSGNSVTVTYTRPSSGGHHYGYGLTTKHPLLGKFCDIDPWVLD